MEGLFPGFTRPVLFSYRFYNQDLSPGALLIEIGGHGNNLNEALYAGQLAAKGLAAALLGNKEINFPNEGFPRSGEAVTAGD